MTSIDLRREPYGRVFGDRTSTGTKTADEPRVSRAGSPVYVVLLGLALLLVLAKGFGLAPPPECSASPRSLVFGVDQGVTLTTKSGVLCPLSLSTPAAAIDELRVVSPPAQGTVVTDGPRDAIYRANPGFHGEDTFTVAMRGRSRLFTGTSIVRVNVTAQ